MMGLGTIPQQAMGAAAGPPAVGPAEYVGGKNYVWTSGTQAFDFTGLTGGTDTEPQDGDLFILIYSGFQTTVPDPTVSTPAGYVATLYNILQAITVDARQRVDWGIYESASASGGSWTGGTDVAQIGTILVFRNVDTVEAGTTASAVNTNRANPPAVTPLTDEALIVWIGCGSRTDASLVDYDDPLDGFALTKESALASNTWGGTVMVAAKDDFTTGSFDPAVFTGGPPSNGNLAWIASTLSLKPAIAEFASNAAANNLIYHFDAGHGVYSDDGVTLATNGQGVRRWDNKGTAENAVQPTAARRPIFRTGGLNGHPYIEGIRADQLHFEDLLEGDQPAGVASFNPHTVVAVVDSVTIGQNGYLFGSGAGQNSGKQNFVIFSSGTVFSVFKFSVTFAVPDPGGPNVLAGTKRNSNFSLHAAANQTTPWTGISTSANANGNAATQMGFMRHNGGTETFSGHVYEAFYFMREMPPVSINGIVEYLKRKYGI